MIRFVAFVWLGLVLGVSFVATPAKFRAQSLTLPVALDVGRATFHAFGIVEWVMAAVLAASAVWARTALRPTDWALMSLVAVIVLVQAVWLIPHLDIRVAAVIAGDPLPRSHLHSLYVGVEVIKALALFAIGIWTANHVGSGPPP